MEEKNALKLSNDELYRITKESLQTALIQIMKDKNFEDITITELVKKSGVSRTAFYRHYSTKEDIVREMAHEFLDGLEERLGDKYLLHNFNALFLELFNYITEYQFVFEILDKSHYPKQLYHQSMSFLERIIKTKNSREYYYIVGIEGAFMKILFHWFNNGMKETPEEMADLCVEILSGKFNHYG